MHRNDTQGLHVGLESEVDTDDRWTLMTGLPVLASLALTSSSRTLSSKSVLAIAGIISLGWGKNQSGARQK